MSSNPVVPPAGEIEVKLGDGSVVKGTNIDDAFKNLAEMKVNASKAIKEKTDLYEAEKAEREKIARELETTKAELEKSKIPPPPPAPKMQDDKFNKELYFQYLGEDPMKAQDYLDAFRFGIDSPDKVRGTFNGLRQAVDDVSKQVTVFTQQNVTSAFLAQHPDYPQGDAAAAETLTKRVQELIDSGFPYNASTIEFAYFQLVNDDKIKPLDLTDKNTQQPPDNTPNPNPAAVGVSAVDMGEVTKAEGMSNKDLEALLASKGMFK